MHQNNQSLVKVSVAIVIVAGLLGALSVIAGSIGIASGKIFVISLSVIFFGITGMIPMVLMRKPEFRAIAVAGVAVSAFAFLITVVLIIGEIDDVTLLKLAGVLFIASIALAHISLLLYFNLQNKYAATARSVAAVAIVIFSISLIVRIFDPVTSFLSIAYNQSMLKIVGASFVVDLAATLLVPLCNRLPGEKPVELSFTEDSSGQAT